eukprot:gene3429-3755_t
MGQTVSVVHDAAAQRSVEDERTANDALNSLNTIAQDKLALFKTYVEGGADSKEIPIERVISSDFIVRCGVNSNDANLKAAVANMVKSLISGDFVEAITGAAGLALDALLGSYTGNIAEKKLYKVCIGCFGGIQRIDFYLYSYQFTSKSLIEVTKNVVVCCMMLSSVAAQDVSGSTLRVVLQNNYPSEPIDKLQNLYKMIMNEKEKASGVNLVNLVSKPGQADHTEIDDYGEFFSQSSTAMGCSANFGQPNVGGAGLKGSTETDDYEVSDKEGEFETLASAAYTGKGIERKASRAYTDPNGVEITEDFEVDEIKIGKGHGRGGKIQRTITKGKMAPGKQLNIVDYDFGDPHGDVYSGHEKAFYKAALIAFMDNFKPGGVLANLPAKFTFTFREEDFDAVLYASYPNSFK